MHMCMRHCITSCFIPQAVQVAMLTTDLGARAVQVRAVVDLLPEMEVVEGDSFNSSPTDPKLMGPDALMRFK